MQPLPFSFRGGAPEFIHSVHSVFVSLILSFNAATQFGLLIIRLLMLFFFFIVLLFLILFTYASVHCFYRFKQPIERRLFVFSFMLFYMCFYSCLFAFFSFWSRRTYYDETIVCLLVCALVDEMNCTFIYIYIYMVHTQWERENTYFYSQWFNPCEPIRSTKLTWWNSSNENEPKQDANKTHNIIIMLDGLDVFIHNMAYMAYIYI